MTPNPDELLLWFKEKCGEESTLLRLLCWSLV